MERMRKVWKTALPVVISLAILASGPAAARMEIRDGRKAFFKSDYEEALSKFRDAFDDASRSGNKLKMGRALANMAMVYRSIGQNRKALELLDRALGIARDIKSKELEGMALANMGGATANLGDYEKALEYDLRALALRRAANNRRGEAADLTHIGAIYRSLGQYEKAIDHDRQSLAVSSTVNDRFRQAMALSNLARDYTGLKQYDTALQFHEQSLAVRKDTSDLRGQSDDLMGMGLIYLRLRQYDKALDYSWQALALARRISYPLGQCGALNRIGHTLCRLGRFEEARQPFTESRAISEKAGLPEPLWNSQRGLGLVADRQHRADDAVSFYFQAIDTIESMRSRIRGGEAQITFMQEKFGVYNELMALLWRMHVNSPHSGYDRRAFEVFERKQGRVLLDQIGKSAVRSFSGLPESIGARLIELEGQLDSLKSTFGDEPENQTPDRTALADEQIRRTRQELEALEATVKREYPRHYDLMHPRPATLDEIQKHVLKPDEVILAYEMLEKGTLLWIIATNRFQLVRVDAGEQAINWKVAEIRNALHSVLEETGSGKSGSLSESAVGSSADELRRRAGELHDLLIPAKARELISSAKVLLVVPTGSLYTIPFEMLVRPAATKTSRKTQYLIENQAILYLSSASLLKTLREAAAIRKAGADYPLLVFANPSYPTAPIPHGMTVPLSKRTDAGESASAGSGFMELRTAGYTEMMKGIFQELPDTEDEAREIKSIFGAPDSSNPVLSRQAASRSNLLALDANRKLAEYRYVVFCCHGILPEEIDEVQQPALVLSHPDPVTRREGFVTMADVFSLHLNAELVTLSACNTGSGKVLKGEGMIGLTRSFMYAGTPAVAVTLWSVESNSVRLLNVGLHRGLQSGKRPAEALRDAKLRMIRGDHGAIYQHPFFWAPLVLFGDGR